MTDGRMDRAGTSVRVESERGYSRSVRSGPTFIMTYSISIKKEGSILH
jgi:hypothetical protein